MSWELPPEIRGEAPAALGGLIAATLRKGGFWGKFAYGLIGYGVGKIMGPSLASAEGAALNVVVFLSAIFGLKIIEGLYEAIAEFDWKTVIADVKRRFLG